MVAVTTATLFGIESEMHSLRRNDARGAVTFRPLITSEHNDVCFNSISRTEI